MNTGTDERSPAPACRAVNSGVNAGFDPSEQRSDRRLVVVDLRALERVAPQ
jgi:hypothetical protein